MLMYFIPMGGIFVQSTATLNEITLVGMNLPDGTRSFAWGMLFLSIIILIINVIGIGLYKKRIFQIRFNVLNIKDDKQDKLLLSISVFTLVIFVSSFVLAIIIGDKNNYGLFWKGQEINILNK